MTNKCFLLWTIWKDIELITSSWWLAIAKCTLATSETFKPKDWEKQTTTTWHNLVAFGHTANFLNKRFWKWSKALIEWKISNTSYEKKDWTKWYKSEIIIESIEFAWWPKKEETSWIESHEEFAKKVKKEQEEELSIENIPF